MSRQWVVGGAVRDIILGVTPKDIDFVWTGTSAEDMINMGFHPIEATSFPVFLDAEGNEHALARKERKVSAGYHGFECEFDTSVTLTDDQFRRDLTINQLAVAFEDWDEFVATANRDLVIDPFKGQEDLKYGVICHVSEAFAEDPVRIIRTARFAARYSFTISIKTYDLMKQMVCDGELNHVTPERVWIELKKTLKDNKNIFEFFHVLLVTGALEVLMPELSKLMHTFQAEIKHAVKLNLSVAQKCAIITAHMNSPEAVEIFWKRMKAPNDIISLAKATQVLIFHVTHQMTNTAEQIYNLLKEVGVYRDDNVLVEFHKIIPVFKSQLWADMVQLMSDTRQITKNLSFSSLNGDQQENLKGAEISQAIDKVRINTIDNFIKSETK